MTKNPQPANWVEYNQRVHAEKSLALDYSNAESQGQILQAQTFGIAIEAGGPLGNKRCLDIGCGRGQLALALAAFQAREVVGVDIVAESIIAFRERYPHVKWEIGSPDDEQFCRRLGLFDVIFVIELLQLVEWQKSFQILWNQVAPGGRLVVIVPNKDNPIVQKTIARFEGTYTAPNPTELSALVAELPDVNSWAYRGMDFQQEQTIVPYATSPWTNSIIEGFDSNRLVIVVQKKITG